MIISVEVFKVFITAREALSDAVLICQCETPLNFSEIEVLAEPLIAYERRGRGSHLVCARQRTTRWTVRCVTWLRVVGGLSGRCVRH